MSDRFPFNKLDKEQRALLDSHYDAAKRTSRNTESLRDPLELKYLHQVVTKLYGDLNLSPPAVYVLDSPLSCAFMWAHTPQTTAERWRVFHDEFYTHPLSSPIIDMLSDGFSAFSRLVELNISTSVDHTLENGERNKYTDLARVGDLVSTAITSIKNPLHDENLLASFRQQIGAHVSDPSIRASIQRQPIPNIDNFFLPGAIFRGQDFTTTAYYQALSELGVPFTGYHKNLIRTWQQMNKACHWWFPYKNVLLLSDRPKTLHVDERGRPHNAKGPAVEYRDGWKVCAWKGILIPENMVMKPESLTVKQILDENNTEIRRAMVDIFGLERFVVESKSKTLDQQGEYELLEVPYLRDGSMIALKMRCPTTHAVYVHTVHPECTNVEQALAWKRGEDNFVNAKPYREGLIWEM
jgi:hypothetical protein